MQALRTDRAASAVETGGAGSGTWRVSKNSHSSRGLPVSCVPGMASTLAGSRSPSWMPAGRPRPRPPAAAALRARRAAPSAAGAPGSAAPGRDMHVVSGAQPKENVFGHLCFSAPPPQSA